MKSLAFGVAFGFILSRVGATDYDAIAGMFRLSDLHLMGVIGVAVLVSALGLTWMQRKRLTTPSGESITLIKKPMTPNLVLGSLIFGVGWALAGTCPGTALAQVGEGRWAGIVTCVGILVGSYVRERRTSVRDSVPQATQTVAESAAELH